MIDQNTGVRVCVEMHKDQTEYALIVKISEKIIIDMCEKNDISKASSISCG